MRTKALGLWVAASLGVASVASAQEQETSVEVESNGQYRTETQTVSPPPREEDRDRDRSRFGDMGQLALSAERMFGAGFVWDTVDQGDDDETTTTFNVSAISNPLAANTSAYSFPRIGIDFFIIENISIGAALGFAYTNFDDDTGGPFDHVTAYLAAPRIGYALMFSDGIGIWPRVGVTWVHYRFAGEGDVRDKATRFALTGEIPFVIQPAEHVALLIGPTIDLGLTGSNKLEGGPVTSDVDVRTTELGIQFGLLTYF